MSASREKKQRQGSGASEKVSQTQAEQAAYRKKVRTYSAIGVVVAVLVAALLVWNSGIFQRRATAATIGGETLSAAELSYYYYDARYIYAAYGLIDTSKSDADQMYNETDKITYRDYFLETALSNAQSTLSIYNEAIKAGYSRADVADDLAKQIADMKSSAATNNYTYKSFLKAVYGRYVTPAVFEELTVQSLVANAYYTDVYGKESDSYTNEDLEAYYAEHTDEVDTFTYSYLYFKAEAADTTDEDGNDLSEEEIAQLKADAMAAAKEKAEAALGLYEGGMKLDVLIEKQSPSNSADHTTATGTSAISATYSEALLALDTDEGTVVEYTDNGYYLVVYHGRARNEELTAAIRSIFVAAATTKDEDDKVVAPTDEAWAAAKTKADELLAQWNSGDKTAQSFGTLAEDNGMSNDGVVTGVASTSYTDDRAAWLFEETRVQGDTTITKYESSSAYGYYLTYFEEWEEATWMQKVRATLTGTAMEEWKEAILANYEAALASGADSIGK